MQIPKAVWHVDRDYLGPKEGLWSTYYLGQHLNVSYQERGWTFALTGTYGRPRIVAAPFESSEVAREAAEQYVRTNYLSAAEPTFPEPRGKLHHSVRLAGRFWCRYADCDIFLHETPESCVVCVRHYPRGSELIERYSCPLDRGLAERLARSRAEDIQQMHDRWRLEDLRQLCTIVSVLGLLAPHYPKLPAPQ